MVGDYFRAMGIRVLNGRAFEDGDTQDSPTVVDREPGGRAQRSGTAQNPIGKTVSLNPPREMWPDDLPEACACGGFPTTTRRPKFTVVGVVDDVRNGGLTSPALPTVYAPYAQASEGTTNMFLTVRTDGDPLATRRPGSASGSGRSIRISRWRTSRRWRRVWRVGRRSDEPR